MRDSIILCVDLSYQSFRASAAHPLLTCREHFTGGLYGFTMTLAKAIRETRATELVIGQDRKPYVRSQEYPEYKTLRKASQDQELRAKHLESMELIKDFLEALGIPIWGIDGYEYDDLIGHVVSKYRHRYTTIYAQSNDSDLYQFLWCPNFHFYATDIQSVGKERDKLKALSLTSTEYMLMTAMTGTHNDIEGIPRHGPVTAIKAIKDPAVMRKYRAIYADVIDRNLKLIKLPHPTFPYTAEIPKWTKPFKYRDLYRLLGRYDINTTQSMVDSFNQLQGLT